MLYRLESKIFAKRVISKANIGMWAIELVEGQPPRMIADDVTLALFGAERNITPEELYVFWHDRVREDYRKAVEESGMRAYEKDDYDEVWYEFDHPVKGPRFLRCGSVYNETFRDGIRLEGFQQDVSDVVMSRRKIEEQEKSIAKKEKNLAEITALAEMFLDNFVNIYYVELSTHQYQIYTPDKGLTYDDSQSNGDFFSTFDRYIDVLVAEEDRFTMQLAINPDVIRSRLQANKRYSVNFRDLSSGKPSHFQMLVVRGEDEDHVGIGFVNMDNSVRQEDEQMAVISSLANDFDIVLYVNAANEKAQIHRISSTIKNLFSGIGELNTYTDYVQFMLMNVAHPDDREYLLENIRHSTILERLSYEPSFYVNFRILMGRKAIHYQMKFATDTAREDIGGYVVGFHNVETAMKMEMEHQKELVDARERADQANHAKSEFLFSMSHDIRTPMNAIMGYTDLCLEHIQNTEKVEENLGKIKAAGEHMLTLINEVLDLAQIESGKTEIAESVVDLEENGYSILNIMSTTASAKNIELTFDSLETTDTAVFADKLHLNQVIMNIVSNAIKYTYEGGKVEMILRQIGAKEYDRAEYEFIVKDNGVGMPEDFLTKIFLPFERAENDLTGSEKGSGLGMNIVKKLLDLMHATIDIESKQGEGTTVTCHFNFRVAEKKAEEPKSHGLNYAALEGKRIMVAEDNDMNREIVSEILSDYGMIVDEVSDGSIAVEHMMMNGPDYYSFVLMDIQMPYLDGYRATKAIRVLSNGDYSQVPIIALSANAFEEDKKKSLEVGMNAHITKPISVAELLETLIRFAEK